MKLIFSICNSEKLGIKLISKLIVQKMVFFIICVMTFLNLFLTRTSEFQNDHSFDRKRIKNIWS